MINSNGINIDNGRIEQLMGNIILKVADTSATDNALRFYFTIAPTGGSSGGGDSSGDGGGGDSAIRVFDMSLPQAPNATGCVGTSCVASWNASNFAGFWYDFKDNLQSEKLTVNAVTSRSIDGSSPNEDLVYTTTKTFKTLKVVENNKVNGTDADILKINPSGNGKYPIIGWQTQPYIPVKSNAKKLAKLIIEQGNATSEKKSLTVGETWDIGDGWTLTAQSIDAKASPRQVWLVLSKDGVKKDDKVIGQGGVYIYIEKSFAGESDVPLFITYVDSVFAGATSDIVQLRYTWAISTSFTEVKSDDVFGNMEVTSAGSDTLVQKNKGKSLDLTQDGTVDIMGEMKFKVADNATTLRFYPMILRTEPGTYEVRGSVATGTAFWDAQNFAGFWYDLDYGKSSETMTINQTPTARIID